jgi:hypothetical protein
MEPLPFCDSEVPRHRRFHKDRILLVGCFQHDLSLPACGQKQVPQENSIENLFD